jgi:hypothetical protein
MCPGFYFSRWMAVIYLLAFWSLGVQVLGLVGSHGILPVASFLDFVRSQEAGNRFWTVPTLCWLNHSDAFLLFLCWAGAGLSVLLFFDILPNLTAFLLWFLYLSLTVAAQDFLGFQWDNLLLEAGFLLIFIIPRRPSIVVIWLFRVLLFKLMFSSGMVKLLSGDVNWRNLTALNFHYWTQPLPDPVSWYAAQLPMWFQKFSCLALFIIELILPFFIFFGRSLRLIAFWGIISLQLLIALTGNYCFFNWLAIGLCLTLLMEGDWPAGRFYQVITIILAGFILTINLILMAEQLGHFPLPKPLVKLIMAIEPLRSINTYGLFAVMTTQRSEIILEGSNDGEHWLPYEFPYKPGRLERAPSWVAPYQPRLDWQMWFAALGSWRENQWVIALMAKLLEGEPTVLHLLANNPFPGHPPRYMQATLWDYHFTDFKTRAAHGGWWRRQIIGPYCPPVSLK